LGFGSGFQPVVGFNWGAKRYDRVRQSYRFSAGVAVIGAAIMSALLAVFADEIIMLFSSVEEEQSAQMREIGALCIRLQCLALPIHAWVAVVNMFCTGLGNAWGALILSTSRQGTCFIPLLFPMAVLWGEYGIASVQAAADVLTLVLAIPILIFTNKKIKKAIAAQENSV
jgi:Na+-driven multidrug efflux pump